MTSGAASKITLVWLLPSLLLPSLLLLLLLLLLLVLVWFPRL
jgi:hypothetical protein